MRTEIVYFVRTEMNTSLPKSRGRPPADPAIGARSAADRARDRRDRQQDEVNKLKAELAEVKARLAEVKSDRYHLSWRLSGMASSVVHAVESGGINHEVVLNAWRLCRPHPILDAIISRLDEINRDSWTYTVERLRGPGTAAQAEYDKESLAREQERKARRRRTQD